MLDLLQQTDECRPVLHRHPGRPAPTVGCPHASDPMPSRGSAGFSTTREKRNRFGNPFRKPAELGVRRAYFYFHVIPLHIPWRSRGHTPGCLCGHGPRDHREAGRLEAANPLQRLPGDGELPRPVGIRRRMTGQVSRRAGGRTWTISDSARPMISSWQAIQEEHQLPDHRLLKQPLTPWRKSTTTTSGSWSPGLASMWARAGQRRLVRLRGRTDQSLSGDRTIGLRKIGAGGAAFQAV